MSDRPLSAPAHATTAQTLSPSSVAGEVTTRIESMPKAITELPLIQQVNEVLPAADLLFGGVMLVVIMMIHATAIHNTTNHVERRTAQVMKRPTRWRATLLMSGVVFTLLCIQLAELVVWASAMKWTGLIADWRAAGFFAGSAFTTVGYGSDILPPGWRMLGPIIAISGLFTFGWSGSVLVNLVGRCQEIRDAADAARTSHAPEAQQRPQP
jgi:hypothetical protein